MTHDSIIQYDTLPYLEAQLLQDDDCTPIDLTSAESVHILLREQFGKCKIDSPMTILDPKSAGMVRYEWKPVDTDTAQQYHLSFRITFKDGKVLTVPNTGYIDFDILEAPGDGF